MILFPLVAFQPHRLQSTHATKTGPVEWCSAHSIAGSNNIPCVETAGQFCKWGSANFREGSCNASFSVAFLRNTTYGRRNVFNWGWVIWEKVTRSTAIESIQTTNKSHTHVVFACVRASVHSVRVCKLCIFVCAVCIWFWLELLNEHSNYTGAHWKEKMAKQTTWNVMVGQCLLLVFLMSFSICSRKRTVIEL